MTYEKFPEYDSTQLLNDVRNSSAIFKVHSEDRVAELHARCGENKNYLPGKISVCDFCLWIFSMM